MATSSSAAQPVYRSPSLRFASAKISVAKLRGFPRLFAGAASNPTASVSARSAVPPRAEHVVDRIGDPDYVRPLDTTLHDGDQSSPGAIMTSNPHDGEQSPGPIVTSNDKLLRAHRPARLGDGVDTIEVGFPTYLAEDLGAVQSSAMDMEVGYVVVVCKCRVIDAAGEAGNPRICATCKVLKPEQVVHIAKGCPENVGLSAEDARRSNRGVLEEEIKAAGTTLNILDSGLSRIREIKCCIKANNPGVENATMSSSYCQYDIDLASTNTSEGVFGVAFPIKDLHGMREFKESSETTSSAEDKKPPVLLDSRLHTITDFLNLMKAVIGMCGAIIGIRRQSPEFMWHPCLRDMALFGLGITLAVGLAAMYYGVVVVLKAAESKSRST